MEITEIHYNWYPTSDGNESGEDFSWATVGIDGVTKIERTLGITQLAYTITYQDGSDKIIFNPNQVRRKTNNQ